MLALVNWAWVSFSCFVALILLIVIIYSTERAVLCWPHIARTTLPKYKKKMQRSSFEKEAKADIAMLHLSRSRLQFDSLADLMIDSWRNAGENEVADTFLAEYLSPPYKAWSITSSGIPGVVPNNNAMESYHRDLKRPRGSAFAYHLQGLIRATFYGRLVAICKRAINKWFKRSSSI